MAAKRSRTATPGGRAASGSAPSPQAGGQARNAPGPRPGAAGRKGRAGNSPARPRGRRAGRRRRRGNRTLHYLVMIFFVAAAGVILSLTLLFKIESVQVIGSDRYRPDDIIAASGITEGDNLLRLDTKAIGEKILGQFPYIETVAVKRRFPPKVELVVTRSVPAYAAFSEGAVALMTKEGKLLEKGDILVPPDIPVVRGFELGTVTPGMMIGGEEDPRNAERLKMLGYLSEAAQKTGFPSITNVDLTDLLNMSIVYEARLLLILGSESDLEYKLTFIQEVIGDLGEEDQARIDASAAARDKQVLVKWGRVEEGAFTPEEEGEEAVLPDAPLLSEESGIAEGTPENPAAGDPEGI